MARQRVLRLAAAVLAGIAAVACAPLQVTTFEQPVPGAVGDGTYVWLPSHGRATGDPRLDGHSPFESYVTATIDEQLRARGLAPVATGMPDVVLRWTASTTQRIYRGAGRGVEPCSDCELDIFEEGTLVIDILDGRTGQLVWRGGAAGAIDGAVADQERMERRLHDAIARILERLPRRFTDSGPT